MSNFVLWSLYALILKVLVQLSSLFRLSPYSRSNEAPSSTVKVMMLISMISFSMYRPLGSCFFDFEVFYRYLYCTLIGRMSAIRMCIGHLGFFVHCCGVLSHMFCCIDRQKVSVHWCGCYIRVLQLSCMVVMILVMIWASCDWITSHVLDILLLGLSSYNLVRVHLHDSIRSDCSLSNSISRSVLLF